MPHFIKLHLTTLDGRSKQGITVTSHWQRTFTGGHENRDPSVTPIGSYISDEARSCVNDDCFDLPAFSNRKFQSGKKYDFGDFASSPGIKKGCIIF